MKQTVNEWDFKEAFRQAGREESFSDEGLSALFKEFEDYEDSTGEEIELDVIAICCDYTEYENFAEFNDNYNFTANNFTLFQYLHSHMKIIEYYYLYNLKSLSKHNKFWR